MKICTVCTDFPFKSKSGSVIQGGGAACIFQLVEALYKRGHDVEVVTRKEKESAGEIYPIPVHRTGFFWLGFRESKITHSLFALPALFRVLLGKRFDLVHSHNPAAALTAIVASKLLGIPHVTTFHGPWAGVRHRRVIRWIARVIEFAVVHLTDVITCDSQSVLEELAAVHKVSRKKMRFIPNAVDTRVFAPGKHGAAEARKKLGLPPGKKVVLFTGRFVAEKGLPWLLDAAPLVLEKMKDAVFLLVGGGFEEHLVKQGIEKYPEIRGRIRVIPFLEYEKMPLAYSACDVFVLPSLAEGMSRSIMESLSMGKPVVATNVGGNPEIVKKEFGALVPPKDAAALARAIERVLSNKAEAKKMSRAARAFAERKLSVQARVKAFEEVYEKQAGKRQTR